MYLENKRYYATLGVLFVRNTPWMHRSQNLENKNKLFHFYAFYLSHTLYHSKGSSIISTLDATLMKGSANEVVQYINYVVSKRTQTKKMAQRKNRNNNMFFFYFSISRDFSIKIWKKKGFHN